MSFTYNSSIPATNNNPSDDQPVMQQNYAAISNFVNVDHVSFNNANCGKHLQVTFNSKNTPAAQTDPQSVLYTANGIASSVSQLKYANQSATFPLSTLRAYANFTVLNNSMTATNYFNVDVGAITVAPNGLSWVYTIPLLTGATSSDDAGVIFAATNNSFTFNWSIAGNTVTCQIGTTSVTTSRKITMLVYQL
jgi:hypothetical protein